MDQKINIDVPKATYCSIVALYDDPVELMFESVSMLQRLGALANYLSISNSIVL
jgi:FPC/CPF motif-containing protein YcgG